MSDMDAVTRQNAALVEQAAASSAQLRQNAQTLANAVRLFKTHRPAQLITVH
jgi:methyl-accepting chemotaxis protein-1 (serine sensor receptor)